MNRKKILTFIWILPPPIIFAEIFLIFRKLNKTQNYEQPKIQQSLAYRLAYHRARVAGAVCPGIH